jgi:tetraacyldisaccharide 4'-kinase
MKPATFRDLVSGQRQGWEASLGRGLLTCAALPYSGVMRLRNLLYDLGLWRAHRVGAPVVSVGNLTLGGTGKTPLVRWLADWFLRRGVRVGLVSRGYKAGRQTRNDEALELAQWLPDVPHLQDPNRVRGARQVVQDHTCQVVLLDDAFQHRRVARDLDIVLLDALEPFGWDRVFPRGTLREPAGGLRRAAVVALSRSDAIGAEARDAVRRRVERLAPRALWLELVHQPDALISSTGRQAPLAALAGRRVAAFCGLGNPAGFRHTLHSCGFELADFREFPDHHGYTECDLDDLGQWAARQDGAAAVLCTAKDLVKLKRSTIGPLPLWALTIRVAIPRGREEFETVLGRLLLLPGENQGAAAPFARRA